MTRLRQDPVTWEWVIAGHPSPPRPDVPLEPCPFCPAQQTADEPVIAEHPRGAGGDWLVRVVADRAPLLRIEGELDRVAEGMFDTMNAVGAHEIVIEGREHAGSPGRLGHDVWCGLLQVFRDRVGDLKRDARFRYVEVVQNHGLLAGALVTHPHAQVIATPVLPHRVGRELRGARQHYEFKGRCLYCDVIRAESEKQTRVVDDRDGFLVVCPYASRYPYEMWVLPRRHESCFEAAASAPGVIPALAGVLRTALQRAESLGTSLHWVLHTEPSRLAPPLVQEAWATLTEDYHWHVEIVPRLEARRKYMREEDFFLNPILPEDAARELRRLGTA